MVAIIQKGRPVVQETATRAIGTLTRGESSAAEKNRSVVGQMGCVSLLVELCLNGHEKLQELTREVLVQFAVDPETFDAEADAEMRRAAAVAEAAAAAAEKEKEKRPPISTA